MERTVPKEHPTSGNQLRIRLTPGVGPVATAVLQSVVIHAPFGQSSIRTTYGIAGPRPKMIVGRGPQTTGVEVALMSPVAGTKQVTMSESSHTLGAEGTDEEYSFQPTEVPGDTGQVHDDLHNF